MLGVITFPSICVHKKAGDKKKYVYNNGDNMTARAIVSFVNDVEAGRIEPFMKSEQEPDANEGPVKVFVAASLRESAFTPEKDVMLQVYALWCGHCKKFDPEYTKIARKVEKEGLDDLLVIAKMDGTANDSPVDSVEWTGFPTIFYIRAGTDHPEKYEGECTAKAIWKWVSTHHSKKSEIKARIAKKKALNQGRDQQDACSASGKEEL